MSTSIAKFTPQQAAAITTRGVSIALSAGAGCGKTFVLTERFLAHLEPGDPGAPPPKLHELIAITFTDRAAREMRDRIRKKCLQRLESASEENASYWLGLLRSLDRARVSTIHSFCGSLLRANAVEAQLDPRFTVIDQAQADTLMSEIIDDVLREQLIDHDEQLLTLVMHFGLDRLRTLVMAIIDHAGSIDFDKWLSRSADDVVRVWSDFYEDRVVQWALKQVSTCEASRELLHVIGLIEPEGELRTRCEILTALLPKLHESAQPVADLESINEHARIQGVSSKKLWPNDALKDRFKLAAEQLRGEAKWALGLLQFDPQSARADADAGLQLLALVRTAYDRYETRKAELAWLDFGDLLVRARALLTDPRHAALQKRLAAETRLLLVDECQDTDPLQVELIKALCGPTLKKGKLFFVGDYKQSIYRFRGADPAVFRKLECDTPKNGRLPLSRNFRSQPAILDFVNALFHGAALGGDEAALNYEPLTPHHQQLTPLPAIEFQWSIVADLKKSESGARYEARRREADAIARRIRAMLDSKEKLVRDESGGTSVLRPVEKRDIALLFRALSDVQQYEEALRRYDIDYYLVGGRAFYTQQEIYDVTNLLRTLVSPADEVSLVGVLRSPMFSLTDETLFWLAEHPQGLAEGLYSPSLPDQLSADDRRRVEMAANTLRYLREIKDSVPIAELLNEAFRLTGYDAALLGDFLGERKLANLRKLVEQARTFDESGALSLPDFIVQLSEFVARQPREPLAATHPEGTDVVRLMTIHQSKGLEFPVVFVPDICRSSFGRDDGAIWDHELGPLVKLPQQTSEGSRTSGIDLYRAISNVEEEAERLRLLYVATTRAADFLVLSSGVFDIDVPDGPWQKLLAKQFNLQTGEFIGDPLKGYRPQVRVRTEPVDTNFKPHDTYPWRRLETQLRQAQALAKKSRTSAKQLAEVARYVAPVPVDRTSERRFSVSRFTGRLQPTAERLSPYDDDEEASAFAPGGVEFGTLVHKVLAIVDFARPETVAGLVDRAIEQGGDPGIAEPVKDLIERFLASSRGRELAVAAKEIGRLHRELEFVLTWPPKAASGLSPIYLHGFIDCLYQGADGGWRLLDFKTNRVAAAKVRTAAEAYRLQMGVYALAVEQILGVAPSEIVVHFLRPGVEHWFEWNDEFRQETTDAVTQEIDNLTKGVAMR